MFHIYFPLGVEMTFDIWQGSKYTSDKYNGWVLGKQQDVFQVKFEHIVLIVELGLNYIAEIRVTVETLVQQLNKKFFVCFRSCVSWTTQLSTGCGSWF